MYIDEERGERPGRKDSILPKWLPNRLRNSIIQHSAQVALFLALLTAGRLTTFTTNNVFASSPETPACSGMMFGHEFVEMNAQGFLSQTKSTESVNTRVVHSVQGDIFHMLPTSSNVDDLKSVPSAQTDIDYSVVVTDNPDCTQTISIHLGQDPNTNVHYQYVDGFFISPIGPVHTFDDPFAITTEVGTNVLPQDFQLGVIIAIPGAIPAENRTYWIGSPLESGWINLDMASLMQELLDRLSIDGIVPGNDAVSAIVASFSADNTGDAWWTLANTKIYNEPIPTPVPTPTFSKTPTTQPSVTNAPPTNTPRPVVTNTPSVTGVPPTNTPTLVASSTPRPTVTAEVNTVTPVPGFNESSCTALKLGEITSIGNVQVSLAGDPQTQFGFYSPTEHGSGTATLEDINLRPRLNYLFGYFGFLNGEVYSSNRSIVVEVYDDDGAKVFEETHPYENQEGWNRYAFPLSTDQMQPGNGSYTIKLVLSGNQGDVAGIDDQIYACTDPLRVFTPTPLPSDTPTSTPTSTQTPTPVPTCVKATPGPTQDLSNFTNTVYFPVMGGGSCQ